MEEKKNNSSLIVLVCLIVAAVICCTFLVVKQLNKGTTPKSIFVGTIENLFKTEKNEKEIETLKGEIDLSFNVKTNLVDSSVLDIINKLTLGATVDSDLKNNKSLITIDSTYDNSDLVKGKIYVAEEEIYFYLTDVFNKWVKVDSEYTNSIKENMMSTSSEIDMESVNVLLEEGKDVFLDSLKDTYFTKEKEDDLTKVTLVIDQDNILDIVNDFVDNLEKNTKFKDAFKKLAGVDLDTLLEQVKPELKKITKDDIKGFEKVKIAVYADKDNNLKKLVIDTTIEGQILKLEAEIKDSDNMSLALYISGIKFVTLSETTTKDGDYKNTELKLSVINTLDATIKAKYKLVYNEKIDAVDVSNSVSVDELTEADVNTITEKIMSNRGLLKLMTAIENVTSYGQLDYNY